MPLSNKQKAFISEYLIDFNATRAAQRAGYKGNDATLASTGWEVLRNPEVEAAVRVRLQEKAMSADEVLMRLAENARADMGEWLTDDGEIDIAAMKVAQKTNMLRKVKRTRRSGESESGVMWDETTIEVELHDQQAALVHIGKAHGLFTDKIEHDGEIVMRVVYDDKGSDDPPT